jgi:hypothetical protein
MFIVCLSLRNAVQDSVTTCLCVIVVGKVFYFLFRSLCREEKKIRLLFTDGEIIFLPYRLYLGVTTTDLIYL